MKNPAPALVNWYASEGRDLPWRRTQNPYRIWLSEIILQQTRVEQGKGYYLKFIERFPTVHDLAAADQDEVLKLWEGLGYYSRARNLHATAKVVSEEMGGNFPKTWKGLIQLKGIGPYTARAISSICFGESVAVVDGNVFRVTSRYLADPSPIDIPATRKQFQQTLDQWVSVVNAAQFNQAVMDLGATICTPKNPQCSFCPIQDHCCAYAEGQVTAFPIKSKKIKRKKQFLEFFLLHPEEGKLWIQKRPDQGIWPGLWEVPNREVQEAEWNRAQLENFELRGAFKHVLTHVDMMIKVYQGTESPEEIDLKEATLVSLEEKNSFAFSRAVNKIFETHLR